MSSWPAKKRNELIERLAAAHPEAHAKRTELNHRNEYELIVAVMLSAQCTDDRVNLVTPALFASFPDFAALAVADVGAIEHYIQSCGLYHNKAVNLQAMAAMVINKYDGRLPQSRAALMTLKGVGRKTANVVLAVLWDIPAMAIDTHVGRVARRLGLSTGENPLQIEHDVSALFPKEQWNLLHRLFIWQGRKICRARKPSCAICPVSYICPSCMTRKSDSRGK